MSNREKGRIRVIGCGGCGINIASQLEDNRGIEERGFGLLDIRYIDTSSSNLHDRISKEHCYILEGLDGSGKLRSENSDVIASHAAAILNSFGDDVNLNIILSSGAGGSGSVIAPLLVRELLQKDVPTIVIMIGSADTKTDANNTLKTLKSYDAVSSKVGVSIPIVFIMNTDDRPRLQSDAEAKNFIMTLAVLFSRENRELDTKDLFHWSRPECLTTHSRQLLMLSLIDNGQKPDGLGLPVTVATLASPETITTFGGGDVAMRPEYQTTGYFPEGMDKDTIKRAPIHFVTSAGIITQVDEELGKILKAIEAKRATQNLKTTILKQTDVVDNSTGLVL